MAHAILFLLVLMDLNFLRCPVSQSHNHAIACAFLLIALYFFKSLLLIGETLELFIASASLART